MDCGYKEKETQGLVYCLNPCKCQYKSEFKIPYVKDGNVGGREHECKKERGEIEKIANGEIPRYNQTGTDEMDIEFTRR